MLRPLLTLVPIVILHSYLGFRKTFISLFLFVLFVYGIHQKLTVRTALFSVPFSVVLGRAWIGSLEGNSKLLLLIPPILCLWSNLHGTYLIGLGIFTLLSTGYLLDATFYDLTAKIHVRLLLSCIVITFLAVIFVKPFPHYGSITRITSGLYKTISTVGNGSNQTYSSKPSHSSEQSSYRYFPSSEEISTKIRNLVIPDRPGRSVEFKSPLNRSDLLLTWVNLIGLLLFGGLLIYSGKILEFKWLIPFFGLVALALLALRTVGYVWLFGLPLGLHLYNNSLPVKSGSYNPWFIQVVTLSLLIGGISGIITTRSSDMLTGFKEQRFGFGTINKFSDNVPEHLLKKYPHKRFFNGYAIGSYLIWKWWPYKKVFQDTKLSAYTTRFQKLRAGLSFSKLLSHFKFKYGVISRKNRLNNHFLEKSNWTIIYKDSGMVSYKNIAQQKAEDFP